MKKSIKSALMQVGATFVIAVVATVFHKTGVISQDTTTRVLMITVGLVIAWQSNATPKQAPTASNPARAVSRLSGWAFVLSGLGYAAVWAFAPIGPAALLSMIPLGIAALTVLVYCLSIRDRSAKVAD